MRALAFTLFAAPLLFGSAFLNYERGVYIAEAPFPFWMAGLYAAVLLLAGIGLDENLRRVPRPLPGRFSAAVELAIAMFAALGPAFLDGQEFPLAFVFMALVGWRLLVPRDEDDLRAAAIAVGLDFGVEAILVAQHTYMYRHAATSPLPLWLPFAWANIGIAARRLYPLAASFGRAPAVASAPRR